MTIRHVSRRGALQFLGSAAIASMAPLDDALAHVPRHNGLSFLGVGDWGREGRNHQRDVARQMARTAQRSNARFVISVGDNFYENGVVGIDDPAWQNSYERIYDAPSLQVPWHVALGNHDYIGNVQAQLDYTAKSDRWHLPARWYDFTERAPDGATAHFFVVIRAPTALIASIAAMPASAPMITAVSGPPCLTAGRISLAAAANTTPAATRWMPLRNRGPGLPIVVAIAPSANAASGMSV